MLDIYEYFCYNYFIDEDENGDLAVMMESFYPAEESDIQWFLKNGTTEDLPIGKVLHVDDGINQYYLIYGTEKLIRRWLNIRD